VQRPLVWTTAVLIGGGALASFVPISTEFSPKLFWLVWLFAPLLLLAGKKSIAAAFLLIASFILGFCLYAAGLYEARVPDPLAQRYGFDRSTPLQLKGTICESAPPPEAEARATFLLEVEAAKAGQSSHWIPITGRTRVNWYDSGAALSEGDVVEVSGKLRLLKGFKNPGIFDYEEHMRRQGIYTRMVSKGADAVRLERRAALSSRGGWRHLIRRQGQEVVSRSVRTPETKGFLCAILLGERDLLTDEMNEQFRRTGTFHILSISGLHVGLMYLIVSLALTPLSLGIKSRAALSILFIWLYALVTGADIPVIRASIMLTLVLVGYLLDREGDFLTAIALAAFVLFFIDPLCIADVSFQLSFAAVILLCVSEPFFSGKIYPSLQRRLPYIPSSILHKFSVTLFASVVVGTGLLPIIAYHFNQVSLVFPFANLLVVPLLSIALAFGFASLLGGFVSVKLVGIIGFGAEAASQIIFAVVRFFSELPLSFVYVGSPPLWSIALLALGIFLVRWRSAWKPRAALFGCCIAAGIAGSFTQNKLSGDIFRVTFFDVGDADSCLLEFPNRRNMLVDAGFATPFFNCGENLLAPFLWKRNIGVIDTLVLTHSDADHCGGAPFILEHFRVRRLVLPDIERMLPKFADVLQLARRKKTAVELCSAGAILSIDSDTRVEVLNPSKDNSQHTRSDNDLSIVLKVTCRDASILLAADAEQQALRQMVHGATPLKSAILKAPHHGFASSLNTRFLERVEPDLIVISGRAFRANDSIEKRISRYALFAPRVLATERDGAVVVESTGGSLTVRTVRREMKYEGRRAKDE
jgi:competence protein ComEC